MSEIIEHYLSEHTSLKGSLPGSELAWLNESREQALEQFSSQGFPTLRVEDWKYTSIRPIEKRQFKLAQDADHSVDAATLNEYLCKDMACHLMVFVDGQFSEPLSNFGELPAGVKINDFTTALKDDTETLKTHLGSAADTSRNGFAAMNMAFMNDGAFIEIEKNTNVELPIHLMFLSTGQHEEVTSQARILILAGESSQAKIIESYQSLEDSVYFNNVTTEVKVGPNANIEHYKVQQESSKAFHIATLQVDQQRDSTFTSHSVSLGAQLARNDINAYMGDEGATCNLYGLYVTDGRQHTDFHTRIDHAQPHCTSNEFYKGILDGHSRAVFNGQVHVHPDAQKSDAQQSNNNLLLSKNAEVDTKPQLEIYADDVTAAHGATVGQLDENMMFYLRSRGIDYNSAHALLVYGFAHSVIEKMSLEPLQKHLEGVLVSRIPNAAQFSDMV
jgi:Fe-S cluster assembly protein SufD